MNDNNQPFADVAKEFMVRVFSSRYTIAVIDLITTTLISIIVSICDLKNTRYIILLIVIVIITIILNFLCIFAGYKREKNNFIIRYVNAAHGTQNDINYEMAGKLYQVNTNVTKIIRERKWDPELFKDINFQTLCGVICTKLYELVKICLHCEECEVSIFQQYHENKEDFVKMIAYKNNNIVSTTLGKPFSLNQDNGKTPFFKIIFKDINARIKVLSNQKDVQEAFDLLDGSEERERKICQYIGVPIKTNRNKIELLLQIDVSKEKVMGKDDEELEQFAKYVIRPFANLLYSSYERDLIFNMFFDILEENTSREK